MKDYASMSDFEINKSVADIAINGAWHVKPSHPDNDTGGWLYGSNGIQTYELPDYCNNPADAWPIITEAKISLLSVDCINGSSSWLAKSRSCPSRGDSNPLRAAMIVFLMTKEGE